MDAILESREKFKERITIVLTDGPYGSSQDVALLLNRLIAMAYTGLKHQSSFRDLDHHKEIGIDKGDIEALAFISSLNQQISEYTATLTSTHQHINTPTQ